MATYIRKQNYADKMWLKRVTPTIKGTCSRSFMTAHFNLFENILCNSELKVHGLYLLVHHNASF